jgi:hypothetical protein
MARDLIGFELPQDGGLPNCDWEALQHDTSVLIPSAALLIGWTLGTGQRPIFREISI